MIINEGHDHGMTEEEQADFGMALITLISMIHKHMNGVMDGHAGFGTSDNPDELFMFHINIHDASLCSGDEDNTPLVSAPTSGSVQ